MPNLNQFKKNGKYLMFAFDHRESFRKMINPSDPSSVTDAQAIALKKEIIESVKDQFSSILIDQDFGLKAYDKSKPFLLPVEKSGYEQQGNERVTKIIYKVEDLKKEGASGAKILLYFNPFLESAKIQLETARKVLEECRQNDFPLFLEIVTYESDHEATMEEREKLVLESLKFFLKEQVVPDVFKLEYPGSALGCQTITAILEDIPWIILTRGVSFEEFLEQLKEASERGCQGFLAGRALWQEACTLTGDEKDKFLRQTLPDRFKIVSDIVSTP